MAYCKSQAIVLWTNWRRPKTKNFSASLRYAPQKNQPRQLALKRRPTVQTVVQLSVSSSLMRAAAGLSLPTRMVQIVAGFSMEQEFRTASPLMRKPDTSIGPTWEIQRQTTVRLNARISTAEIANPLSHPAQPSLQNKCNSIRRAARSTGAIEKVCA